MHQIAITRGNVVILQIQEKFVLSIYDLYNSKHIARLFISLQNKYNQLKFQLNHTKNIIFIGNFFQLEIKLYAKKLLKILSLSIIKLLENYFEKIKTHLIIWIL